MNLLKQEWVLHKRNAQRSLAKYSLGDGKKKKRVYISKNAPLVCQLQFLHNLRNPLGNL